MGKPRDEAAYVLLYLQALGEVVPHVVFAVRVVAVDRDVVDLVGGFGEIHFLPIGKCRHARTRANRNDEVTTAHKTYFGCFDRVTA